MKKLCTLLALVLLLSCIPMAGCTTEPEPNPATDFEYEVNEDGGITITKYIGKEADVVIPAQIEGKDVTIIQENAFRSRSELRSVVVPNTVVEISHSAFSDCGNLESITLSDNLVTIGVGTFQNCTALSEITLPKSLTSIGHHAFDTCNALKSIVIPGSVILGEATFMHSGLEQVTLEEGIETIPLETFAGTSIKELVMPSSVKTIENAAFSACEKLTRIEFNEGLLKIGHFVISGSPELTEITIPSTVTEVCKFSFISCDKLKTIKFEGGAPDAYLCESVLNETHGSKAPSVTIYYHQDAEGFTSPEWNGYPTEIW